MITIAGRSAFRDVAACSDPAGVEPRLFFQRVPEGKTSKNRVHLDVYVDEDRKRAEAEAWSRSARKSWMSTPTVSGH